MDYVKMGLTELTTRARDGDDEALYQLCRDLGDDEVFRCNMDDRADTTRYLLSVVAQTIPAHIVDGMMVVPIAMKSGETV